MTNPDKTIEEDAFDKRVRKQAFMWFGRYADPNVTLEDEAWDRLEALYWESFVVGMNRRLSPDKKREWWDGHGKDYSRERVMKFAQALKGGRPVTARDLEDAFEKAEEGAQEAIRRLGSVLLPVLCE